MSALMQDDKIVWKRRNKMFKPKLKIIFTLFIVIVGQFAIMCDRQTAPYFAVQPSFSGGMLIEGQSKILQCQAIGFPAPEYKWIKDGADLGSFTKDPGLRMNAIKVENSGTYQCVAKNAVGAIFSEKTELTVAYMLPLEQNNVTLVVRKGHAALVAAPVVDSVPRATAHWEKIGMGRLHDRKYVMTAENALVVLNMEKSDQGFYQVVFTNTQVGKEITAGYAEIIYSDGHLGDSENPLIVIPPSNTTFNQGAYPAILQCVVNAQPLDDLELEWSKDDIPISQSGVGHFLSIWNRTLTLVHVVPNHAGVYTCRAYLRSRPDNIVKASCIVEVHVSPSIVVMPDPETVSEIGHEVFMACNATGIPEPRILWYRNAMNIGNEPEGGRYKVLRNGTLHIHDLSSADSGIFQCLAKNDGGEKAASTWLHVKSSSPVLVKPPENLTVLDGKDAQIQCEVSGAPKPSITWTLNGTLPIHSVGRAQILENGALVLQSVEPRDAGTYTCSRTNSAGTVTGSAVLSILVRTQIVRPPADTKVIKGLTTELQCGVSHDPSVPFNITWFSDSRLVGGEAGSRIQLLPDGSLRIGNARNTDIGPYTCHVTSPGGDDSRSARLDVIELPFPPSRVEATLLDTVPKTVNVSWSKTFDGNSPITMYIVQMRVVPSIVTSGIDNGNQLSDPFAPWLTAKANISGQQHYTIIENLKPSSSLQFRVSAVNGVGEGEPSNPTEILILPAEPPSSPPQGVVGAARSSTSIMLQWQAPAEDKRNGDLLGYMIRYKLAGYVSSPWAYENITNSAHHNFLLQDLIVWQRYQIQVSAYNFKGVGMYSEPISVWTREGVPESAPTDVRVIAVNSTCVKVWWRPPAPQRINGINQGYKVEAWSRGDSLAATVLVPPSPIDPQAEQNVLLTKLEKYTWYNVTVLCFTNPGDGPRSKRVETVTEQDLPDKISSLKFDNILDTSVGVFWLPPTKPNGILQGYTVSYYAKDAPEDIITRNVSANVTRYEANRLRPITAYSFQVYAWTVVGQGMSRSATIQSGIPPVLPEPPYRLAVSNIRATSVVLQFTPGFDGNTTITKWTIEVSSRRRNESSWFQEITDPEATNLVVHNLIPFTEYRLRLIANNVVGASQPSEPTKYFQTIQAPPSHAPYNVTVRAVNDKALRVRWTPLQQVEWYGIPRGYNISYRILNETDDKLANRSINQTIEYLSQIVDDYNANSFVLDDLEEFTEYEVFVKGFNDVGSTLASSFSKERTRESIPFVGPSKVNASATSSTTIVVNWSEIAKEHRNGVVEGYKVYYGAKTVPFRYKTIEGNQTFTATLIELKKYTLYSIQVLGYTRIGDGALSLPPVSVQTFEDVPGIPSNVSFPDVSTTTARIIWDVPIEPNGQIQAYRVSYAPNVKSNDEDEQQRQTVSKELAPTDRTMKAFNLKPESYYLFSVTAKTNEGWGKPGTAIVYTTNKREAPQAPSEPQISLSQIQARQMTFSWTPGRDGFAPLRFYTIQMMDEDGPWKTLPTKVDPLVSSYTVQGLKPFTSYQFRLQAINDIGASGWSPESNSTRTLSAAPAEKPIKVTVTPYTTTSVTVEWQPLAESLWNGDTVKPTYRVEYCLVSAYTLPQSVDCPSETVVGINASSLSLQHLEQDKMYEIKVSALNGQGEGPASTPVTVYVGEAVPTGPPIDVLAVPLSATEIKVTWKPPLEKQRNGDLLGYKIFYQSEVKGTQEELEVVPVATATYVIMDLLKFRDYQIQILAFNPAGDGPRSRMQLVKTLEDLPGVPGILTFLDVTMTSLNISWSPPINPNGEIRGYLITYETALPDTMFSKQVKQKVTNPYLSVNGLREEVAYTFSVRAETIGVGPPSVANITTGPQPGSPGPPQELYVQTTHTSVTLHWRNGISGAAPLTGYLIDARQSEESEWQNVVTLNQGSQQSYAISFQNLLPSKNYQFRLLSRNRFGVSFPSETGQPVATPSKMYLEYKQKMPFYREVWFLVILAAATVIIVILVVAVLCVKSKAYKYKHEAQKTIQDDRMSMDDGGFATFELRQSKRGTLCKNTLSRKSVNAKLAKSPPRPSPASITYSDEEDTKGYDDNCDDSSLTEKPSEISSTDSQASDSDRESDAKCEPHSFVNHYANVNDTFRQSWKRQRPHIKPPSYTDSEPEGSLAVSLNGGHIIMNNLAGSRAPLPGFSSFV